jgi:[acyl-carrier-protein] S-malonyltransferase
MKRAFIFPGQGSQYVGMGKDFFDSFLIAKETFEEADDLLGMHLSKLIFEGPTDVLTQTKNSQVAIFVTSVAILRTLQQQLPDLRPDVCSGLSLGEYTALYASGRLGFADTLKLVRERAYLMNEACETVPGTMAAVLGLSAEEIEAIVKPLSGVWVANFNAPGQTVISGTCQGVELASSILKEKGAKRVIPLVVHGAFHSALMLKAQEGLSPFIASAPIAKSEIGFVMNVPGSFVEENEEIRKNLLCQITQSVRWEQGIEAMKNAGVEQFIEIGCGKTLTGLNRKMGVSSASSIEKINDLELIHANA